MAELVFPGTVKIDAEHLESRAELATERIARYRAQLETMNELIKNTSNYWEGEGREAYRKAFEERFRQVEDTLHMFEEYPQELMKRAGIARSTIGAAQALAEALSEFTMQ